MFDCVCVRFGAFYTRTEYVRDRIYANSRFTQFVRTSIPMMILARNIHHPYTYLRSHTRAHTHTCICDGSGQTKNGKKMMMCLLFAHAEYFVMDGNGDDDGNKRSTEKKKIWKRKKKKPSTGFSVYSNGK